MPRTVPRVRRRIPAASSSILKTAGLTRPRDALGRFLPSNRNGGSGARPRPPAPPKRRGGGLFDFLKTKSPKDLNDEAYMKADPITNFGKINYIPFGAICGKQGNRKDDKLGDGCACQRLSGGPQGQFSNDSGFLIPPPDGYKGSKTTICKYNGQNGLGDEYGSSIRDFTGKLPSWSVHSMSKADQEAQIPYFKAWQKEYFT
jgi:hypothetical protein